VLFLIQTVQQKNYRLQFMLIIIMDNHA